MFDIDGNLVPKDRRKCILGGQTWAWIQFGRVQRHRWWRCDTNRQPQTYLGVAVIGCTHFCNYACCNIHIQKNPYLCALGSDWKWDEAKLSYLPDLPVFANALRRSAAGHGIHCIARILCGSGKPSRRGRFSLPSCGRQPDRCVLPRPPEPPEIRRLGRGHRPSRGV